MLSARAVHLNTDGPYHPAKTPARTTRNHKENANKDSMTVHDAKNKSYITRTPFHPKTAQPQRLLKDVLGSTSIKNPTHLITKQNKPLTDKTPFANRVVLNVYDTPAPPPKSLNFDCLISSTKQEHEVTLESPSGSARASSTRKHSRVPKPYANLQTPMNKGNHWDVSDGDIVVPEIGQIAKMEDDFDDSDEVEYMPPNTLSLPYNPPFDFDLPDYTLIGQAALRSLYGYPNDDLTPPTFDFHISDHDFMKWDSLSLPPLRSDDKSPPQTSKHTRARLSAKPSTTSSKPISTASHGTSALVPTNRVTSKSRTNTSTHRQIPSMPVKPAAAKPSSTRPLSMNMVPRSTSTVPRPTSAARPTVSTTRKAHIGKAVVTAGPAAPTTTSASTRTTLRPQKAKSTSSASAKTTTSRLTTLRNPVVPPAASKPPALSSTRLQGPTPGHLASSIVVSRKPVPTSAVSGDPAAPARKHVASKRGVPNTKCTMQVKTTSVSSIEKSSSTRPLGKSSSTKSVRLGSTKPKLKSGGSIPGSGNNTGNPGKVGAPQVLAPHQAEEQTQRATGELTTWSSPAVGIAVGNDIGEAASVLSTEVMELHGVIETLRFLTIIPEETSADNMDG